MSHQVKSISVNFITKICNKLATNDMNVGFRYHVHSFIYSARKKQNGISGQIYLKKHLVLPDSNILCTQKATFVLNHSVAGHGTSLDGHYMELAGQKEMRKAEKHLV